MGQLADRILSLHGWVVLVVVVFLVPALESSAFVGFVFPGEIAVLLGGVLAFQHRAPLAGLRAGSAAGAIAGDSVGYLVGQWWGRRLLDGSVGRPMQGRLIRERTRKDGLPTLGADLQPPEPFRPAAVQHALHPNLVAGRPPSAPHACSPPCRIGWYRSATPSTTLAVDAKRPTWCANRIDCQRPSPDGRR